MANTPIETAFWISVCVLGMIAVFALLAAIGDFIHWMEGRE